jgi:Peptidase family C54
MSSVQALSSSTASSLSTLPPKESVAVLVRGPEFRCEEKDIIAVEPGCCTIIDLSESPRREKNPAPIQVPAILQAMFRGVNSSEDVKQEEHELIEHPNVRTYFDHQDISRDYGYKYEFCEDDDGKPNGYQEATDGNCCRAEGGEADFENDSDYEGSDDNNESLLDHAAYSSLLSADHHTNRIGVRALPPPNLLDINADPRIYLLGKWYDIERQYEPKRDDELSLFWFTYRGGFPEIAPYGIFSDAGWGCMLRSAQMMLAQALRVHFKSREWKSHRLSISQRRREPFLRSLLTWMADFPSASDNVFAIHQMVACGMAKYEILPGEWYGPTTACHVLRDLVQGHEIRQVALWKKKQQQQQEEQLRQEQQQQETASDGNTKRAATNTFNVPDKPIRVFRVYVASQSTVYTDAVRDLMTKESRADYEATKQEARNAASSKKIPNHPLEHAEEELKEGQREQKALNQLEWDTGLLLLIPLRLGLNGINEDYIKSIAYSFSIPYSVGALGGRPRGARW